jgi:uncharacterized protein
MPMHSLTVAHARVGFVLMSTGAVLCCLWQAGLSQVTAGRDTAAVSCSDARVWVLRLRPGEDLVESIVRFCKANRIEAGGIATCVGSLKHARLRYANQQDFEALDNKGQHFEIVSLVGTVSTGDYHLHLAVANERGEVFGGHAGPGNRVYTTAEIIIIEGTGWLFRREPDENTTYRELVPVRRNADARFDSR